MRYTIFTIVAVAVACMVSCAKHNTLTEPEHSPETGSVHVTLHAGQVGALHKVAKSADIEMHTLYIALSAKQQDTLYDTLTLTGGSQQRTERKTYSGLVARSKNDMVKWRLSVMSMDRNEKVVHSGDTVFTIVPFDTADVALYLYAQYSMLKAVFRPIPAAVNRCELVVNGKSKADSSFTKKSLQRNEVRLSHDYLHASPEGVSNRIELNVYGRVWGVDTLLYTGATTITVVSGKSASYKIPLAYVLPEALHGAAAMTVTLGTVETVTVEGIVRRKPSPRRP